jgi:uncharacterized membrane protein YkvA (DUF1232 family)
MKIYIDNEDLSGCVRETVDYLFRRVLKRKKPKTIRIQTGDPDYMPWGTFNNAISNENDFSFKMNAQFIRESKEHECQFRAILLHELMHAADMNILQKYILYRKSLLSPWQKDSYKQLQWLLWALDHFRAEGIADLCTRLLWQRKEKPPTSRADLRFWRSQARKDVQFNIDAATKKFAHLMEQVMAAGDQLPEELSQTVRKKAYSYGCPVILRVLRNLRLISETEEQRIGTTIRKNGNRMLEVAGELSLFPEETFDLGEKEIGRVLNICLSVNLPLYLEGLLLGREGKPLVSLTQLMTLCGNAQGYRQDDKIPVFVNLITAPQKTVADFNKAMRVLAGRSMTKESLNRRMDEFKEYPGWSSYLGFNDKINQLFGLYQDFSAAGLKNQAVAANHALHYFFRHKDSIADYVPAFGFVDDLLVVDTALEILGAEAILPQGKHLIKP